MTFQEPGVVAAIAAAGALLAVVLGGAASAAVSRWRRAAAQVEGSGAVAAGAPPADDMVTSRVVGLLRRRPWVRRGLSVAAVGMAATGVALLAYPLFTDVVQGRIQTQLAEQLASPRFRSVYLAGRVEEGDSLTRLRIPSIGVDVVVVEGTSASALRAGAGHYPDTPLPCQAGNVAVAGHRTTYGRPFRHVDQLAAGDEIILETPIGSCTYRVSSAPFVVAPTDLSVVAPSDDALLTLTTCHPVGSAAERLVVRAELVASDGAVA